MDNLIGPVWDITKCMCTPFGRRIQYARKLGEKIEKLDRDAQILCNRRKDIEKEEELSNNVGRELTEVCKGWIEDVEKIERQRSEIKDEYALNKKCLSGLFPDMAWRMSLGKRIEEAVVRIGELKERSKFEGGFLLAAPPPTVVVRQLPTTVEMAPIENTLQKVLVFIRREKIHRIGIWGMGGVGKTTVMTALNNLPAMSTAFESVIWVTVSSQGSVEKIQKDIANHLQIGVNNADTIHTVANRIHQTLSSKKFLLLLDDVWQSLDLGVIGIPNPNEQEKGSKVVLTTREKMVCNCMHTDEIVAVDTLSKEEAWSLFAREVGDVVNNSSINPYAKDAVEECDGLPLAIIVLGAALKNIDNVHVWRCKLRELQSSTSSSIESMEDVFKILKFSYDQLRDDNIKQCFLYCALYPEDEEIEVNELIDHWRADGLTDDAKSIIDGYDKGHDLLNTLIQKSLLQIARIEEGKLSHCRMHDVLRDLALRITSPKGNNDNKFLVRAGVGDGSYLKEEEWKQMKRISFIRNDLDTLPESPDCPILSMLLLQYNGELQKIPNKFFQHMVELQVLDLSSTGIRSLPSSISSLVNLQGLYLNYCYYLADLPSEVGSLKNLEELQMVKVKFKSLPFEIRNLNRLISFKFSPVTGVWVNIPAGVIKSLISLEQLQIGGLMPESTEEVVFLDEVATLRNLTKIHLRFPDAEHLERFLSSSWSWEKQREQGLLNFRFIVNDDNRVRGESIIPQPELSHGALTYSCRDSPITPIPPAIVRVLTRSQEFYLSFYPGIKTLSEFGMQNIKGLKICQVWDCDDIEILANGDESEEGDILPDLEELALQSLPKLRTIMEGQVSTRSFSNLISLRLLGCHRIKHIFSWSMIKQLSKLERLSISVCHQLEDIFEENEIEPEMVRNDGHQLPRLKFLTLFGLPKLVSIDKIVSLASVSIEEISIGRCGVKSLPSSLVDAPKLRRIAGSSREWWDEELEWEDNAIKQRLQLLFSVLMKVALKLDLHDDIVKKKAMKKVSGLAGVDSISMDMKDKKLTVIGDFDPVHLVSKLRKLCPTEILSVGPAKEPEKKKEEPNKEQSKEKDQDPMAVACKADNPHMTSHYYVRSVEEDPNACVIS